MAAGISVLEKGTGGGGKPKSTFPVANFIISQDEIWVQGGEGVPMGGGGGATHPPTVVNRSNTSLGWG